MRQYFVTAFIAMQLASCSESSPTGGGSGGAQGSGDAGTRSPDARVPGTPRSDASVTPGRSAGAGGQSSAGRDAGSGGNAVGDAAPSGNPASGTNAPSADAAAGVAPVNCTGTLKLDSYVSDPKLCVYVFASDLGGARQLAFAPNGDLFVNNGRIVALWDADGDGTSGPDERSDFGRATGLNHGVVFSPDQRWLYASSSTTVYRFSYKPGDRTAEGAASVVIAGIPDGGHSTRTLAFDSMGRLIVSIGSASNVDMNQSQWDSRSQLRRYTIPETLPNGGLEFMSGEVIAYGMRNEAGVFVDTDDRIWSVENGRDNLSDDDLGGDIHTDNPGEEINLVDGKGPTFYGYPHCYSEFMLSGGLGQGTQWADQTLPADLQKTDEFCRDPASVRPPAFVMPAHWAPLGIIRYSGRSLPMTGDLIIGAHGSWNREPATGRVVARARVQGDKVSDLEILIGEKDGSGQLRQGNWNVRPVDVRQGPDEAVYVSDDLGGRVLKLGYQR